MRRSPKILHVRIVMEFIRLGIYLWEQIEGSCGVAALFIRPWRTHCAPGKVRRMSRLWRRDYTFLSLFLYRSADESPSCGHVILQRDII